MKRILTFWMATLLLPICAEASTTLIARGDIWKFLDSGTDQGTSWRTMAFNDLSWTTGTAPLGFGDSHIVTTVNGGPSTNRYPTVYFRKKFVIGDAAAFSGFALNVLRDDGAVIYLNGTEVARTNMPAGSIAYSTWASSGISGAGETTYYALAPGSNPLVSGTNLVAVEVHQVNATSSDLGFDMDLIAAESGGSGVLLRGPYLQCATPTSIVIRWRTSQSVIGVAKIGASPGSLGRELAESVATTEHEVAIGGLSPATTYYYSVGSAVDTLAGGDTNHRFTTPPLAGATVDARIWVLGDSGTGDANQAAVRDAFYSFTGARMPDLWLMLGDNAYDAGTDAEYQTTLFNVYGAMLRTSPVWPALGNHDTAQATAFIDTYPYFDIFTLPKSGEAGGVPSGTEHYYSFDYAQIHFICLDSMTADRSPSGAMATWLQADLASTTARWIIAYWHHPPYTKGSHNSDSETGLIEMRENFLPILEAGGVDLVLCGHSHSYERSYLLDGHYGLSPSLTSAMILDGGDGRISGSGAYIKPLTGPRDHFGAVYAVAGSSGKTSGGALNHPAMFVSLNQLGSMVLDVSGTQLNATFLRENGSTPDSFTILKRGAADSDGDGIPDEYEMTYGLNRKDSGDALLDQDRDGTSNLGEFVLGLNAKLPDRYAWSISPDPATGGITIAFQTQAGRNYQVLWSEDLLAWYPGSEVIPGTGVSSSWTDTGTRTPAPPAISPARFYRVQVSVSF